MSDDSDSSFVPGQMDDELRAMLPDDSDEDELISFVKKHSKRRRESSSYQTPSKKRKEFPKKKTPAINRTPQPRQPSGRKDMPGSSRKQKAITGTSSSQSKSRAEASAVKTPVAVNRRKSTRPKRRNGVLNEIHRLRLSTKLLIRKAPFARLLKEISGKYKTYDHDSYKWQTSAVKCLQEASEMFLVDFFEKLNLLASHSNRVTITMRDVWMLRLICPNRSFGL